MRGKIISFKTRLFGGFDRRDVISYIEKLAAQRNKYLKTAERLETQMNDLRRMLSDAELEIADANRRLVEVNVAALNDASETLTRLQESYESIRLDMELTTAQVKGELCKVGDTLLLMSTVMNTAGHHFSELRAVVEKEKNDADET